MNKIKAIIVISLLSTLLVVGGVSVQAQRDTVGWIGPIYSELAESLTRGFKEYYREEFGKEVNVEFTRPGGWPVCVDRIRDWDGEPDADVFLGAGAPAHRIVKAEGYSVPYFHEHWDRYPDEWHGMTVKGPEGYWTAFAPWLVTNLLNERMLDGLGLPEPETWADLKDPIYKGELTMALPYASGTVHEMMEIHLQAWGEEEGWKFNRYLAANVDRFSTGSTDTMMQTAHAEATIGLAQPQMNAMAARADGYPVVAMVPEETIVVPEAAAILKGAKNPEVAERFMDWLYSRDGQIHVLKGRYFPADPDINFTELYEEDGVEMGRHAVNAIGVDSFWDIEVDLLDYDLDLAEERWDRVNNYYEETIFRKFDALKNSLSLIRDIEQEIEAAKDAGDTIGDAEEIITEARETWEQGEYARSRTLARRARDEI